MASARTWTLLFLDGLLEIGWAIGLENTEGFTCPIPTVLTSLSSMVYGVCGGWTRWLPQCSVWCCSGNPSCSHFFLALMIVAIIGLKITSGH